jgi:hypothetical protein
MILLSTPLFSHWPIPLNLAFSIKYLEAVDGERMKAGDCVNSGVPCSPQIPIETWRN